MIESLVDIEGCGSLAKLLVVAHQTGARKFYATMSQLCALGLDPTFKVRDDGSLYARLPGWGLIEILHAPQSTSI